MGNFSRTQEGPDQADVAGPNLSRTGVSQLLRREFRPSDVPAILCLLGESLGNRGFGPRSAEFWSWKHSQNPFGPSFLRIATTTEGEIVGLRAFMRWTLRLGNRTVRAVQAVDTVTSPAYRRRGIFTALTREMIELVREKGVEMIFNTPNRYSKTGYRKLGWQEAGSMTPAIHVLRPLEFGSTFLRDSLGFARSPVPRASHATPVENIFQNHDALARLIEKSGLPEKRLPVICTHRSVAFLKWRYSAVPGLAYNAVVHSDGRGYRAILIFRQGVRFGLKEVLLSDMFLSTPDPQLCWGILDDLKSQVEADYMLAYFRPRSFMARALARYGFNSIPAPALKLLFENRLLRFRESQKPRRLMFNLLSPVLEPGSFSLASWSLCLGDLEIF